MAKTMLKPLNFIMIGWYPWIKKTVNYCGCKEGKRGLKFFQRITQNAALFVDLSYNIYCAVSGFDYYNIKEVIEKVTLIKREGNEDWFCSDNSDCTPV